MKQTRNPTARTTGTRQSGKKKGLYGPFFFILNVLRGVKTWRNKLARNNYKSDKRRKELARLKKQEEKRLRRLNKDEEAEGAPQENDETEGTEGEPQQ